MQSIIQRYKIMMLLYQFGLSLSNSFISFVYVVSALCSGHHENPRATNNSANIQLREDGLHRSQEVSRLSDLSVIGLTDTRSLEPNNKCIPKVPAHKVKLLFYYSTFCLLKIYICYHTFPGIRCLFKQPIPVMILFSAACKNTSH